MSDRTTQRGKVASPTRSGAPATPTPVTISASVFHPLLARLLNRFEQRRPIRTGSLIVTIYGDAIQPRGGSLWLGALNALVAPLGIGPGLVRTALSRLSSEGWFERSRIGRNSYYRLSASGEATFLDAAQHIYRGSDPPWSGRLQLAILASGDSEARQKSRAALSARGFGPLASNVWMRAPLAEAEAGGRAAGESLPDDIAILNASSSDAAALKPIAAEIWALDNLGIAYERFIDVVEPIAADADAIEGLDDQQAFLLRILLIHEYRRIVLRDPQLPAALLPEDWPGRRAREVCCSLYARAAPGSERWLDRVGGSHGGSHARAVAVMARRFSAAGDRP